MKQIRKTSEERHRTKKQTTQSNLLEFSAVDGLATSAVVVGEICLVTEERGGRKEAWRKQKKR